MPWKHAGRLVDCARCKEQMEQWAPAHKYCVLCSRMRLREAQSAAAARRNASKVADLTDFTTEQRRELLERPCEFCKTQLEVRVACHKIPLSKGGDHTLENMEALCRSCQVMRIRHPRSTHEEAKAYLATLPAPGKLYF